MTTQDFLPIEDIKNDLVILKDGSVAMIVQTSAVNFDLLSQNEQLAIIGSFAALLNSLSFSIQIIIRSKRLDISSYLEILKKAEGDQKNPLLQMMMVKYRNFVSSIIRENEVLDKQFYVVISVSSLELGLVKKTEQNLQKAITLLIPRRDHILRQLSRIGLKSSQLTSEKLIMLFYDIYNESVRLDFQNSEEQKEVKLSQQAVSENSNIAPQIPTSHLSPSTSGTTQPQPAPPAPKASVPTLPSQIYQQKPSRNVPFVVEELPDEYTTF